MHILFAWYGRDAMQGATSAVWRAAQTRSNAVAPRLRRGNGICIPGNHPNSHRTLAVREAFVFKSRLRRTL